MLLKEIIFLHLSNHAAAFSTSGVHRIETILQDFQCASSLPSCILPLENSSFIPLLFDKPVFFVLCSIFPSFLCFTRRERSTPCDTCFCTVVDRSIKVSLHFKRPQRAFFFFYMLKAPLGVVLKLNTKKYRRLDCSLAENGYR